MDRLYAFIIKAMPDAGYRLSQVQAQSSSGIDFSGNVVTIDSVYGDKAPTLSFVREQVSPTPTLSSTATVNPTASSKP